MVMTAMVMLSVGVSILSIVSIVSVVISIVVIRSWLWQEVGMMRDQHASLRLWNGGETSVGCANCLFVARVDCRRLLAGAKLRPFHVAI